MTWITTREPNLLDTIDAFPAEWWLVYGPTERPHWWNRWLAPRFQHVHALRRDGRVWVLYQPYGEFLDVTLMRSDATPWQMFPGCIYQRVVALRRHGSPRSSFFVGPITCTEHVKALLGIRSFFVRTPYQLYAYCRRHFHEKPQATRAHVRGDRAS